MRLLLSLVLAIGLAKGAAAQQLAWLGGQPTGGWYVQAQGLGELIHSKDARYSVKPSAGAAFGNVEKVQRGEAELAWSLPPVITAGYNGEAPFKAPQSGVRLVMTGLGFVHTHFVVADESAARSVADLFRNPIRLGAPRPGGSDDWELRKIFDFYKASYADFGDRLVVGSFADMVARFRDRKIDAFMLNNAVPADDVEQAATARRARILPMDPPLLAQLERFGLVGVPIKPGSYPHLANNGSAIATAAMANTVVTSEKMPEAAIHDLVRILLANLDAVRKVHPAFADFDPRDAVKLANVPLHPGAERAYREAGLLR